MHNNNNMTQKCVDVEFMLTRKSERTKQQQQQQINGNEKKKGEKKRNMEMLWSTSACFVCY